ncbi:MAG: histidinol-phosphate transaminase [Streptomycetaceae bacterium]|nr:MAG: histidinol-phosphate transaminase [Streptomycetaceae bacterium]
MSKWSSWLPLRQELRELSPYGAPQLDVSVRLNTNENPYSLSPEVCAEIINRIKDVVTNLNRYPDRDALTLRGELANYINMQSETDFTFTNIWAANGSNEILQSIFLAFGEKAMGFLPSYSMHPLIAKTAKCEWVAGSREPNFSLDIVKASLAIADAKPNLVFVTTPNNPTGTAIEISDLQLLADECKKIGALLIIDEAYAEFASGESAVTLIAKNSHVLVVRTMSKAFAFAGVRVGYLVANSEVIDALLLVRLPYHLGSLTQAAASAAISMSDRLLSDVAKLKVARSEMASALILMGLNVVNSDANFIAFSGFSKSEKEVWAALVQSGILVRDIGIPGYLRVTIGTAVENAKFLLALQEVLANG